MTLICQVCGWHDFSSVDISDVSDLLEESERSRLNNVTVTSTSNLIDNIKFDMHGPNQHATFDRLQSSNVENESNPKFADVITDVNAVTQYDIPFQTVLENIPLSNTKHVVLSKTNDLLINSQFNVKPEVNANVSEVDNKVDQTLSYIVKIVLFINL